MLMGLDVIASERSPDAQTAIHACRFFCFPVLHLLIVSFCSVSIPPLMAGNLARQAYLSLPKELHELHQLVEPVSGVKPTSSRWKEDWEGIELLMSCLLCLFQQHLFMCRGKSLVKLVTRLIREFTQVGHNAILMLLPFSMDHLVKKIRLRTMQSDTKIFNALSRLVTSCDILYNLGQQILIPWSR
jgi:hypothetical protein